METLQEKIVDVLKENLPTQVHDTIEVGERRTFLGPYIVIRWAAGNYEINNVENQKPQVVSFSLDSDLTLKPQVMGGSGGRRIYFKVLPEDETYMALHGVNVPFRKPKNTEDAVIRALGRFAGRWVNIIKENANRLRYTDEVDYSWV